MSSDAGSLGGGSTGTTGSGAITYSSGTDANAMSMEALAATPWAQLWDKVPIVSANTSKGVEFLDRFGQFIKERAQIEEEYAAKLKNLAKKSRSKKTEDEEFRIFTTASAFHAMLNELESLASQHEVIGERLRGELLPQLSEKCRQFRATRKKHSQDFDLLEKSFQARVEELIKQKKNYEKNFTDAQTAHVKYMKAEKNLNLSRLEVEKAKQNANAKSTLCEQSKQNYAAQLASTNKTKFEHYNVNLPQLLEDMRRLDIERIHFTKKAMLESINAETGVMSIIQRCYVDMNTAIGTIDPDRDTQILVEQTKTGYSHPQDFLFEDLGNPSAITTDDTGSFDGSTMKRTSTGVKNINGKGIPRKQSMNMKLFSGSNGGKANITSASYSSNGSTGEYGNLPPQQRCRRIEEKLAEFANELTIKEQSQAGLEKMHLVYSQNPKMGDPLDVQKQIEQNRHEMNTLHAQIHRFKNILIEAQSELNQPLGGTANSSTLGSSPSLSPRGSVTNAMKNISGTGNGNGHQQLASHINESFGGSANTERGSSYSEVSSISSTDGVSHGILPINGARRPNRLTDTSIVPQTTSTISTSGFSSTSARTSTSTSIQLKNQQQIQHIDADFYEECDGGSAAAADGQQQRSDLVLGTATALYPYDAAPDEVGGTTISMRDGDDLLLLEKDVGDGWTRVRHQRSNAEGFVPTSYLDCKWYPTH